MLRYSPWRLRGFIIGILVSFLQFHSTQTLLACHVQETGLQLIQYQ